MTVHKTVAGWDRLHDRTWRDGTRHLIWIICAFLLSGCMHSRILTETTPPDSLVVINAQLGNRAGHVDLEDETRIEATRFVFSADSTFCFAIDGEAPRVFPNSNIRHVAIPDRKLGVVEGVGYGALSGGISGGVIGFVFGMMFTPRWVNDADRRDFINPVEALLIGALAGAVPGAALGLYVGAVEGSILEIRYQFPAHK